MSDVQAEEDTALRATIEELKAEVLKLGEFNRIFGQVILRDPDAIGKINCVDTKDLVDIVGIDHNIAHKCNKMCEDIYTEQNHREQCRNLPVRQIEKMLDIHDVLEDPRDRRLEKVYLEYPDNYFKTYFDISILPFYSFIDEYSKREAEDVLVWILKYPDIIKLIGDTDAELSIIKRLFQKSIEGFDPNISIHRLLTQRVGNSYNFMEAIIDEGDDKTLEWSYNHIITKSETCSNGKEISLGCFTIFCEMGKDIDKEAREDWLHYSEFFETYISEVIKAQVNGTASPDTNQWDTKSIKEVDNVNDFYVELCGNLATVNE